MLKYNFDNASPIVEGHLTSAESHIFAVCCQCVLNLLSPLPHHSPCTEPLRAVFTTVNVHLHQRWKCPMIKLEGNFWTNRFVRESLWHVWPFFPKYVSKMLGSCHASVFIFISYIKLSSSCSLWELSELHLCQSLS